MRVLTLKEIAYDEFNKLLAMEGSDVRAAPERPSPKLIAREGKLLRFGQRNEEGDDGDL